jgi:hypothetical protein
VSLAVVHLVATFGGVVFASLVSAGTRSLVRSIGLVSGTHIVSLAVVYLVSAFSGVIFASGVSARAGTFHGTTTMSTSMRYHFT